jgi:GntR family transcriptional regulator
METEKSIIEFHLDGQTGVAPYLQIVHQVKQALRLGLLQPGDQLPTMREMVGKLAINPNTVFKAYRTLEMEGLVSSRPGKGTFIVRAINGPAPPDLNVLRQGLFQWLQEAYEAGLDAESIQALFDSTFHEIRHGIRKEVQT